MQTRRFRTGLIILAMAAALFTTGCHRHARGGLAFLHVASVVAQVAVAAAIISSHDAHYHDHYCGHRYRYHDGRYNYWYGGHWEYYDDGAWYGY